MFKRQRYEFVDDGEPETDMADWARFWTSALILGDTSPDATREAIKGRFDV